MTESPFSLKGQRILVTGASSDIGRATSVLLAQLGAAVVASGRNPSRLEQTIQAMSGTGHSVELWDLSDCEHIVSRVKAISATGPLNGLVHCAGVHSSIPLRRISSVEVDRVFDANVKSALLLAKGFSARGVHLPGASIVFVSSTAGRIGAAGIAAYSASKGAVESMARSLAVELAPTIRVNVVVPGIVDSGMSEKFRQNLTADQWEAIVREYPLGIGKPEDVAASIGFLLSPGSRWITGASIVIDGGTSIQ